jgi:hypothetical protein
MIIPEANVDIPTVEDSAEFAFGASHDYGFRSKVELRG